METKRPYEAPDTSLAHFLLPRLCVTRWTKWRRWSSEPEGSPSPSIGQDSAEDRAAARPQALDFLSVSLGLVSFQVRKCFMETIRVWSAQHSKLPGTEQAGVLA